MIANFHGGHARSHFPYNPRALMAKDRRKNPLAILALQRVSVGMADACRHDFYQNLARLGPIQIDFMDFKRLVGRDSNGCTSLHGASPRSEENTSELQTLMRISYAVFCLKK